MSQRELVLGYEHLLESNWSVGIRGVARELDNVIEDITLDRALYEVYGVEDCKGLCEVSVLTNPGSDFSGWFDVDGDGELDPIYLTAEQLRYPEAVRTYYAVELNARRRFANGWTLDASYTWSHSYGNSEGLVNSDFNQVEPYFTASFDVASLTEHAYGDLPNDRRHSFKATGSYQWPWGLQAGGFFWYRSGTPVNGFGMHPTDPWGQEYQETYGIQAGAAAFYNDGEPCPRGFAGTTDAAWSLDATLGYTIRALGAEWQLRLDVFNVFNNDAAAEVNQIAERENFEGNPSYLLPQIYQEPRSVRLGFAVSF
jgi:hypothetical protein